MPSACPVCPAPASDAARDTRVHALAAQCAPVRLQTRVLASTRGNDTPLFRVFSGIAHPARGGIMAVSNADRRNALLAAAQQELDALAARGVRMRGNAFSAIILVKGELNANELAGGELLAGADGAALAAALERLGYAPEEFCALSAIAGPEGEGAAPEVASGRPLPPVLFREALEALDPEAVVLLDDTAASLMREAYAEELARIEQFDMAMLAPGLVAHVLGRRVLALDGFEAALADGRAKQRMWAYLKQLSPLGAPY